MTPDVDSMLAGREMDKLIAEKVMGWGDFWSDPNGVILMGNPPGNTVEDDRIEVPHYSTDIAAAWQIVEYSLQQRGWGFHSLDEGWSASFFVTGRTSLILSHADTAPLAICRAAFLAVHPK